jgi:2-keto-4-pentenoate hydratase/2-oxohepta-3-ene-1,7-dioic acid hydratase in catechol pathway
MRLVTGRTGGRTVFGPIRDGAVHDLSGAGLWADLANVLGQADLGQLATAADASPTIRLDELELDLPIPAPARILCVGLNYHDHRAESAARVTSDHPTFFVRFASSLVPAGQPIVRPSASDAFDYEGELAVIIGRPGRAIALDEALDHVGGYSCFMDGSIRDYQRHSSQFTAGKNFEQSGSFGPWIVTPEEFDAANAELTTTVDGREVQHAPIKDMIHSVAELIAYASIWTTLEPGDVIATGTPGGVGYARTPPLLLRPGDTVDVTITGIGTLTNPVVGEEAAG